MTATQQSDALNVNGDDNGAALCVELRRELERLGVALPALMPLAWCGAVCEDGGPSPLIWLGTCDAAVGQRLLGVLRGCGA
jgi:hypothetical protein